MRFSEAGYCVVGGQKIPLQRPRVRDTRQKEVPLGSHELMQRASLMGESVWQKIMHGPTTRRYSQVIDELEQAYGIKKPTISEHFIEAGRQRLDNLLGRRLNEYALCAVMIDGTPVHGQKLVLGLRQGATAESISKFRDFMSSMVEKPFRGSKARGRQSGGRATLPGSQNP